MRYCHRCDAQFAEGFSQCLHCGGVLEGEARGASRDQSIEEALRGYCLLGRLPPREAYALLEALDRAGVGFVPVADGGAQRVDWLHGSFGHEAFVEVYVRHEDLESAAAVERSVFGEPEDGESAPGDERA